MPISLKEDSTRLFELSKELMSYKNIRDKLIHEIEKINEDFSKDKISANEQQRRLNFLLKGKSQSELINVYNGYIHELLNEINKQNSTILTLLSPPSYRSIETVAITPLKKPLKKVLDLEKLNINLGEVKKFVKSQKKQKSKKIIPSEIEYTVYKSNAYGRISNAVAKSITITLMRKYSSSLKQLFQSLRLADIKVLSSTYISMAIFSSIIAFPIVTLIYFLFTLNILTALLIGLLGSILTLIIFYYYPFSIINSRSKKIKTDLVFAVVHMAAISGSGIQPVKIFNLLLDSGEYKYLESELRKITNYINLFGYSLSTALRSVAAQTPSYELKELLNGIVATIETGGDLKKYLQDKAADTLATYRLDQKKYTDTLSTYSDVYTGILIAAPLLFLVTLAILDKISPDIGGIKISVIATFGTYIAIPLINVGFIIFINLTQQEM
ncbi:MAG TPA: type II secretion system F family protein [Candidatus Nanoarchaeia archaeon]|nr:type II secretion system F family protein [Candidatus Nanoarchaeia archaeon]